MFLPTILCNKPAYLRVVTQRRKFSPHPKIHVHPCSKVKTFIFCGESKSVAIKVHVFPVEKLGQKY